MHCLLQMSSDAISASDSSLHSPTPLQMILLTEAKGYQQARIISPDPLTGRSLIPEETIPLSNTSDLDDLWNTYAKQDGEVDDEDFDNLEKYLDEIDAEKARSSRLGIHKSKELRYFSEKI